jgi:hypothetical protein
VHSSMRTTALFVDIAMVLSCLSACGDNEDDAAATPESPPSTNSPPKPLGTPPIRASTAIATDGLDLNQQMPIPPELAGQFDVYTGGNPWGCETEASLMRPPLASTSPLTGPPVTTTALTTLPATTPPVATTALPTLPATTPPVTGPPVTTTALTTSPVDSSQAPPSFSTDDAQIGTTSLLCGAGFNRGEPVSVTVVDPQGAAHSLHVEESQSTGTEEATWTAAFFPEPGSLLGVYRIVATQADIATDDTFIVASAADPNLIVSTGQPIPDRTPARLDLQSNRVASVFVVGFPPSTEVRLFLFAIEDDGARAFRRELPSVMVDDRGEGTLYLEVDPVTRPGTYCVAHLQQLSRTGQLTNDPCYRPGAHYQELIIAG